MGRDMEAGETARILTRNSIRVLIVDDSAVMRSLLRGVLAKDARLEVAGTASDGESALRAMELLRPDLVLLDVEMPVMDGLSTLHSMKANTRRIPVIMCSSLTQRGAKVTIEALANGAADYVAKPSGMASREAAVEALAKDLIPKILALTNAQTTISAIPAVSPGGLPTGIGNTVPPPRMVVNLGHPIQPAVVVIGVSTGGPAALDVVLPALPAHFPLPVLIVQHMPELFTRLLAERLDGRCPLRVREAVAGEPVCPGNIYIARGGRHMEVTATDLHPVLRLTQEAPENYCRPAADVLFRSANTVFGSKVLAVVLTGMGYDGLAGSRLIRDRGGMVIAQDEATSAVWGMPGAVAQAGLAHHVLPLQAVAPEILRLTGAGRASSGNQRPGSQREAFELRESAV